MDAKTGKTFAAAVTLSRIPLGVITGILLWKGNFSDAFTFYFIGLLTDVLDGEVARRTNATSTWGADLDRRADMAFNALAVGGFCLGAYFTWGNIWWALGPFLATGGLVAVTRPFFQPHSAASKLRSGVIRLLLIGFVMAKLPWNQQDAGTLISLIVFGIPVALAEWKLTREEVQTGKRRWFKRPLAPLASHP